MASVKLTLWTRNWLLDNFHQIIDYPTDEQGIIRFYSGTQPASPEDAPGGGNTLLATRVFANPAMDAASGGTVEFALPLTETGTDVSGTVTWARILNHNGDGIMDLDVGTSGTSVLVSSTSIGPSTPIQILSGVIALGAGT